MFEISISYFYTLLGTFRKPAIKYRQPALMLECKWVFDSFLLTKAKNCWNFLMMLLILNNSFVLCKKPCHTIPRH